jgi:hypothetical protein
MAPTPPFSLVPVSDHLPRQPVPDTDADTHIELVTYGESGDAMSSLFTLLTGDGTWLRRPLMLLGNVVRHPIQFLKTLWPFGWSHRTVILLVMQSLDDAIALKVRKRWFGSGVKLRTQQNPEKLNLTYRARLSSPPPARNAYWYFPKRRAIGTRL